MKYQLSSEVKRKADTPLCGIVLWFVNPPRLSAHCALEVVCGALLIKRRLIVEDDFAYIRYIAAQEVTDPDKHVGIHIPAFRQLRH